MLSLQDLFNILQNIEYRSHFLKSSSIFISSAIGGSKLLTPVDELDVSEAAIAVSAPVPRAGLEGEVLELGAEQGLPLRHGGGVAGVDLGDLILAVALEDGVPLAGEVDAVGVVALGLDVGGAGIKICLTITSDICFRALCRPLTLCLGRRRH